MLVVLPKSRSLTFTGDPVALAAILKLGLLHRNRCAAGATTLCVERYGCVRYASWPTERDLIRKEGSIRHVAKLDICPALLATGFDPTHLLPMDF